MEQNWDQRYRQEDTPWDSGQPSNELLRVLEQYPIAPCRALEVGCGTGTNSVYLASCGFDMTGFDLAPTAIAAARQRALQAGVSCRFFVASIFQFPLADKPFPFIVDLGCFHVVRQIDEAAAVAFYQRWLAPGGWLLVMTGNAREKLDPGPPVVSEEELRRAFADHFEIQHLREFRFETSARFNRRPLAWSLLMKR